MSHLQDNNIGYFAHLIRAWKWAFVLLVHGLFPFIWETKVSDEICGESKSTRKYLLKNMYGIDEDMHTKIKKWEFPWLNYRKKEKEEEIPSIWERLSDKELAEIIAKNKKK